MKNKSLIAGIIIVLILLLFTFICENKSAFASDQKLVHGAGTLPHLTSAITVSVGAEFPTPIAYALRYDIGLGNRVQLGIAAGLVEGLGQMIGIEVHSMFNVLKTANDSDFLSLYLNPGIFIINDFLPELFGVNNITLFLVRPGVAYEHRLGDQRLIGFYIKVGAIVMLGGMADGEFSGLALSPDTILIDCRAGLQALLGKRFSIALEPMVLVDSSFNQPAPGGKAALTWAY